MDYHYHARTTIHQRKELAMAVIEDGQSSKEAEVSFKLSRQSAAKWVRRFRDRSCRPRCSPRLTSTELVERVEAQRLQRWTGTRIAREFFPIDAAYHFR
jgi:transposase